MYCISLSCILNCVSMMFSSVLVILYLTVSGAKCSSFPPIAYVPLNIVLVYLVSFIFLAKCHSLDTVQNLAETGDVRLLTDHQLSQPAIRQGGCARPGAGLMPMDTVSPADMPELGIGHLWPLGADCVQGVGIVSPTAN